MKRFRKCVVRLSVAVGAALALGVGEAVPITGSFEGRAINVHAMPWQLQEGDPVTGSFYLDASVPLNSIYGGPGYTVYEYWDSRTPVYPFRISYDALGGPYSMESFILDVTLYDDGRLRLHARTPGSCCGAYLELQGAPGDLFDAGDPNSIHAGPVNLAASVGGYGSVFNPYFDVAFSRFTFDGLASVPEPASPWLLVGGMAAWGLTRRRAAPPMS